MPVAASHLEFSEAAIPPHVRRLLTGPWVGRPHPPADLVRAQRVGLPSKGSRPPYRIWPVRASLVLATFAGTKVARLPGRDPAHLSPHRQNFIDNNSVLYSKGWVPWHSTHYGLFVKLCYKPEQALPPIQLALDLSKLIRFTLTVEGRYLDDNRRKSGSISPARPAPTLKLWSTNCSPSKLSTTEATSCSS